MVDVTNVGIIGLNLESTLDESDGEYYLNSTHKKCCLKGYYYDNTVG